MTDKFESKLDPYFRNYTVEKINRQRAKASVRAFLSLPEVERKEKWGRLKTRKQLGQPLELGEYLFVKEMEKQAAEMRQTAAKERYVEQKAQRKTKDKTS